MKTLITGKGKVPVGYVSYKTESDRRKQLMSAFENIGSAENTLFKVENTSFEIQKIQSDSLENKINDKFKDSIQKDIHIGEAYSVVLDLLRIKKAGE